MALVWWARERLLAADTTDGTGRAVAAGVLWGIAILTRETVLYFVPLAAVWLATRPGSGARVRAAAFLAVALLVVAPWTYRNWLEFHAFVPVSTAGGQNLFQGNALIERDRTYEMVDAVQGRVEQYHYAMRMGLQAILDRQPLWIFEKLRDEMPRFWEADSLALIHVFDKRAYGEVSAIAAATARVLIVVPYLTLLAFFVAGVAQLRPDRRAALLL